MPNTSSTATRANPAYALKCLETAYQAGARWVVLCDTNGGALPFDIERAVGEVVKAVPGDHVGIHCHNDAESAVANSLIAVRAGCPAGAGHLERPGGTLRATPI